MGSNFSRYDVMVGTEIAILAAAWIVAFAGFSDMGRSDVGKHTA